MKLVFAFLVINVTVIAFEDDEAAVGMQINRIFITDIDIAIFEKLLLILILTISIYFSAIC